MRLEECLHRSFDEAIRRQLDPVWNSVSWKTRQLVRDMGTVRSLATHLLATDAGVLPQSDSLSGLMSLSMPLMVPDEDLTCGRPPLLAKVTPGLHGRPACLIVKVMVGNSCVCLGGRGGESNVVVRRVRTALKLACFPQMQKVCSHIHPLPSDSVRNALQLPASAVVGFAYRAYLGGSSVPWIITLRVRVCCFQSASTS